MIQEYINSQPIDQLRKKIIKIFKEIGFKIDIETNFKIVDFLDVIFNLINDSYYADYAKILQMRRFFLYQK